MRPGPAPSQQILTHPFFVFSLLLLLLNDHVLKGASVLPGWVTGKLSDFVGPAVALMLLYAVGCHSRRALTGAAAAISVGFGAINLWTPAAETMTWLTGLVGYPWSITMDPTDLVGLVALVPTGWWLVRRRVQEHKSGWTPTRAALAVSALGACVATSPPISPIEATIFTQVGLLNNTPQTLFMRVRPLRPDLNVDCFDAVLDPAEFFSADSFGEGITWEVVPKEQVPAAQQPSGRTCEVVLLEIEGMAPSLVVWESDLPSIERPLPLPRRQNPGTQTVNIVRNASGNLEATDTDELELLFPGPDPVRTPQEDQCAIYGSDQSVTWATPVPLGPWTIRSADTGLDGCVSMELLDDSLTQVRWYACVPEALFPFEAGDEVTFFELNDATGAAPGSHQRVVLEGVQSSTGDQITLTLSRGQGAPAWVTGVQVAARAEEGCAGDIDACGTHRQAAHLRVEAGPDQFFEGSPGETLTVLEDDAQLFLLHVGRVSERAVVNTTCEPQAPELGPEMELIGLHRQFAQ